MVQQLEALSLELGGCSLDGRGVGDLELDAGLGDRTVLWPLPGAEAGLRSLRQRPDTEMLATADLLAAEIIARRSPVGLITRENCLQALEGASRFLRARQASGRENTVASCIS